MSSLVREKLIEFQDFCTENHVGFIGVTVAKSDLRENAMERGVVVTGTREAMDDQVFLVLAVILEAFATDDVEMIEAVMNAMGKVSAKSRMSGDDDKKELNAASESNSTVH
jgi:hypothetical protein